MLGAPDPQRPQTSYLAPFILRADDRDWGEDWAAVWTETGAGQPLPTDHSEAARREEIDQRVLANLLRLNLARSEREEK